ncbi:hypothetical protein A9Q83_01470 [Alphaproteobacteria bacterium 46_93_T64]|nr:hypothetical protein A9Q83_01470 [Alphaproteobacteria bacterium 46_93_T64]
MRKFLLSSAIVGLILPATVVFAETNGMPNVDVNVPVNVPINVTLGNIGANNSNIQGNISVGGNNTLPGSGVFAQQVGYGQMLDGSGAIPTMNGSAFQIGHIVSQNNVFKSMPVVAKLGDNETETVPLQIQSYAVGATAVTENSYNYTPPAYDQFDISGRYSITLYKSNGNAFWNGSLGIYSNDVVH